MRSIDKVLTKHLLAEARIPTPEFFAFSETAFKQLGAADTLPAIEERLDFPIVVKPASGGSALGIKFARTADDVPGCLVSAFAYDQKVLLERHVSGRDLAVSVVEGRDEPLALPVVEAVPREEDFYDFEARYEIGRTDFVCPAELEPETTARAQQLEALPEARAADAVDDQIERCLLTGDPADLLGEVLRSVVDRVRDAEAADGVVLGRRRGAEDLRAGLLADLGGRDAHPSSRRLDEQPLACPQRAVAQEPRVGRGVHDRE